METKKMTLLLLLWAAAAGCPLHGAAQPYKRLHSESAFQDKSYYFLTLLQEVPAVRAVLGKDTVLQNIRHSEMGKLKDLPGVCGDSVGCYLAAWRWTEADNRRICKELSALLTSDASFRSLLAQVRACGDFVRYDSLSDDSCLRRLWQDAADGMNYCLGAYMKNAGLLYPGIDSTHYPVSGHYYGDLLHEMMMIIARRSSRMHAWFDPVLSIVTELLAINDRDEATRYDPEIINAPAYARIPSVKWPDYPYSAIVVLGEGPEDGEVPLSPHGKYRCQVAAAYYRAGRAPFILVSGGHVHPFQTKYCEAIEMRKYLVGTLGIPTADVIADPVARHTTTNLRNANRVFFGKHFPRDKPVLGVTSPSHADYVLSQRFRDRCLKELGYMPFRDLQRVDPFTFAYLPEHLSLQVNALDPLDP